MSHVNTVARYKALKQTFLFIFLEIKIKGKAFSKPPLSIKVIIVSFLSIVVSFLSITFRPLSLSFPS